MPRLESICIYPIKSCHSVSLKEANVTSFGLKLDRKFMFIDGSTGRFITQRKYASMVLIQPVIDFEKETLTLTGHDMEPCTVPIYPDLKKLEKKQVVVWNDTLTAYDMGDAPSVWINEFFRKHRKHDLDNNHNVDDVVVEASTLNIRMVTLDDSAHTDYVRSVHKDLPGVNSQFSDWSPITLTTEASVEALNKGLIASGYSDGNEIPVDRFRSNLVISGTEPWEEDNWLVVKVGEVTIYVIRPLFRCTVPSIHQDTGIKDNWGQSGVLGYLKQTRAFPENPKNGFFAMDSAPLTSGTIRVGDPIVVLERAPEDKMIRPLPVATDAQPICT